MSNCLLIKLIIVINMKLILCIYSKNIFICALQTIRFKNKSIKSYLEKVSQLKAVLKNKCINKSINSYLWMFLFSAPKLFHSLGAAKWKAQSPSVGRHRAFACTNKVAFLHAVSSYMYNLFKGRVVKSYGILLSKG